MHPWAQAPGCGLSASARLLPQLGRRAGFYQKSRTRGECSRKAFLRARAQKAPESAGSRRAAAPTGAGRAGGRRDLGRPGFSGAGGGQESPSLKSRPPAPPT